MTRTCVRCGRSIGTRRACPKCVTEVRAKFGDQRTGLAQSIRAAIERKQWPMPHAVHGWMQSLAIHPEGGHHGSSWPVGRRNRGRLFRERVEWELCELHKVTTMVGPFATAEDLAPLARLFAEWAYRLECAERSEEAFP